MRGTITLEFLDYWHCGAGYGEGGVLDAVVVKTAAGLPYVPGRTLRGVLRDALEQLEALGHADEGAACRLFGSPLTTSRYETDPGRLTISDATLPPEWEAHFSGGGEGTRDLAAQFYDDFASTSLDEERRAMERTLRRIQVTVPVTLHARFEIDGDADFESLSRATALVRGLGSGRTRGFGRVNVTIEKERSND